MSFTNSIVIGPEFFDKAKNDYQDWHWAIAREFGQNCFDAPDCDEITVEIEDVGHDLAPWTTRLTVENNGAPMSREILTGKLLALGGSGKNCQGTVGGFGKAKEILYFCHKSYRITTGDLHVDGSGAGYNLTELPEHFHGTRSTVEITDKLAAKLADKFRRYIVLSQWRGRFRLKVKRGAEIVDGTLKEFEPTDEVIIDRLCKGRGRKDLEFGRVYTNDDHPNLMVVRINGTPMFTRQISYKGCVVLELNGKSTEVMQSSRDGLKWMYGNQLDNFVVELSVNKRSALKDNGPTIEKKRYTGYKLKGKARTKEIAQIAAKAILRDRDNEAPIPGMGEARRGPHDEEGTEVPVLTAAVATIQVQMSKSSGTLANPTNREVVRPAVLKPDFFMKNETGLKIPAWFTPEEFSDYSKTLIWRWMQCLLALADTFECQIPFSVGFIFSEECEAQHEKEGQDRVIYISPAKINRYEGKPAAIERRWKFDQDGIWYLVSVAAHEFVHLEGFSAHDENYSTRYTEVMGRVLAERTKFAKIFQAKVEWPED